MTGFGDFVSVDGDGNANGYNFTTGGVSLGIDYRLTDELVVGVMGEYSHTWTSLKPSGNNDVNSGRGGIVRDLVSPRILSRCSHLWRLQQLQFEPLRPARARLR